jgi:DNA-directed RNA polymerase specialized sigma subunit
MQVGDASLLKAINNFDLAVSSNLAVYAQPCISGEIKRLPRPRRPRQRRADRPPAARDVPRGRVGRRAVRQLPGSAAELRTAVAPGD